MARVKIYTKVPCSYCGHAKRFLQERNVDFQEIDLTNNPDELERIKNETGWRTVPIIFINERLVGGYTDLRALDDRGELEPLLKQSN